jgi:glutamine phosphoribosylpyrophosphate amidotransferase
VCGIFGFVGVPDLDQNDIDVLVRHSQQRGKDSSGQIVHDGDNYPAAVLVTLGKPETSPRVRTP